MKIAKMAASNESDEEVMRDVIEEQMNKPNGQLTLRLFSKCDDWYLMWICSITKFDNDKFDKIDWDNDKQIFEYFEKKARSQ